jgi:hypothetical protein
MKNLIFIVAFLCISLVSCAQSVKSICVSADCKDTITATTNPVSLTSVGTSSSPIITYLWKSIQGTAIVANPTAAVTSATGLNTPGLFVFSVTATSAAGSATAFDSVMVIAVPAPTLTKTIKVYSDGSIIVQ